MAEQNQTLQLIVLAPEGRVVEAAADQVLVPGHDGQVGILPSHAPLVYELEAGLVRYDPPGANSQRQEVQIAGGFAKVQGNEVMVLTSEARRVV